MGARIAMVAEWYPPATGGMEEAARRIARQSLALGLSVDVVTPDPQPRQPGVWTVTEADGITVTRVTPGTDEPLRLPLARALAARGPFDGVMAFCLRHFAGVAVQQAQAWAVPSLVCARGSDVLRDLFRWETVDGVAHAIRRSTRATAVTPEMARLMATLRPDGRVDWWPNTVDMAAFAPAGDGRGDRQAWGLPTTGPLIGFVGILRPVKGQDVLLDAFARLHRDRPDASLVLVGEQRAEAVAFLTTWRTRNPAVAQAVREVPYVPQEKLPGLLHCLDQVWLPSLTEGFSNSLIECLACEVPVLATPVGAAPDVIRHGENGLLVPVGDAVAWATAARRLLTDPAGARQMATTGRQSLASAYGPEAERARLVTCFRDLGWLS
jgi:glycosyltransferase involved in cell wall biosynthesis